MKFPTRSLTAAVAATVMIGGSITAASSATSSTPRDFAGFGPVAKTLLTPTPRTEQQWAKKVQEAGYQHKRAQVGEVNFSYVEGPDNGEPLVLLHAQLMNWFDYTRVLPELAEDHHVFVVDYQGHGETTQPADYPMNVERIGTDLATFIEQEIGSPVNISGNSSGGLIATWLGAHRPDLVQKIALEDPPLFASEYPRIKQTVAIKAFESSFTAVRDGYGGDFLMYWLDNNKQFFNQHIFPGSAAVIKAMVVAHRTLKPGQPVTLNALPNDTARLLIRSLGFYDPRFGAAFYDGSWHKNFDHAEALRQITAPTLLMHANYSWNEDDLLDGAMDQDDADRVMANLSNGTYERIDSGHVIHLEEPEAYIRSLNAFLLADD